MIIFFNSVQLKMVSNQLLLPCPGKEAETKNKLIRLNNENNRQN